MNDKEIEIWIANLGKCIEVIRNKHPNAPKPDPDGEPPWHLMGDDAEYDDDVVGNMPCPICQKGELVYAISGYNGHVCARCSTEGCMDFRQ